MVDVKKTPSRDIVETLVNPAMENPAYIAEDGYKKKYDDPSVQLTNKQKSEVRKIVPDHSIRVQRKAPIPECTKEERKYGWEYIEGVFENRLAIGESKTFSINAFPGDTYDQWTIPANVPIAIPRFLAKHLNDRKWKQFAFKEKNLTQASKLRPGDVMQNFDVEQITHTTTFIKTEQY